MNSTLAFESQLENKANCKEWRRTRPIDSWCERWLEQQGHFTGYRAEIDRRKVGLGVLTFVRLRADRSTGAAMPLWHLG